MYAWIARVVLAFGRLCLWRWRVEGAPHTREAVYLIHHQNLYGPVRALMLFPFALRLWTLSVLCDKAVAFAHYYRFTFTKRKQWPKPCAFVAAAVMSRVAPWFMRKLGAIAVHRRDPQRLPETFAHTQQALARGESVLISPDRKYADPSPQIGPLYSGFLQLNTSYYYRQGRPLAFVPLYVSAKQRCLRFGAPLVFSCAAPSAQEQDDMLEQIRTAINDMGREMGDIA